MSLQYFVARDAICSNSKMRVAVLSSVTKSITLSGLRLGTWPIWGSVASCSTSLSSCFFQGCWPYLNVEIKWNHWEPPNIRYIQHIQFKSPLSPCRCCKLLQDAFNLRHPCNTTGVTSRSRTTPMLPQKKTSCSVKHAVFANMSTDLLRIQYVALT